MSTPLAAAFGRAVGQKVELRLKDGRSVFGRLAGTDDHLNLVLEEAEIRDDAGVRRLGRLIVRGSGVSSVHTARGPRS